MQSRPSEFPCHMTQSAEWKKALVARRLFPQTQFVIWKVSVRTPMSQRPKRR